MRTFNNKKKNRSIFKVINLKLEDLKKYLIKSKSLEKEDSEKYIKLFTKLKIK